MFRAFWSRCPGDLMRQTGLAQVFEDAVFPAVLYLPSLTPVEESVAILNAAYPALMVLVGINPKLAANELRTEAAAATTFTQGQQKLLDRLVREGILVGYHHASEHVRIVELLCDQLRCIVNWMGILTVKYMKVCQACVCVISDQLLLIMRRPYFFGDPKTNPKKTPTQINRQTNYKVTP